MVDILFEVMQYLLIQPFQTNQKIQDQLWKGLEELFSITRENAQYARTTIVQRSAEIAEDNLRGQW